MTLEQFRDKVLKGNIYSTRRINMYVADENNEAIINMILHKYINGDFGLLCEQDSELNTLAIQNNNGRVFAVYKPYNADKIYIITDDLSSDEFITTILFADEY